MIDVFMLMVYVGVGAFLGAMVFGVLEMFGVFDDD